MKMKLLSILAFFFSPQLFDAFANSQRNYLADYRESHLGLLTIKPIDRTIPTFIPNLLFKEKCYEEGSFLLTNENLSDIAKDQECVRLYKELTPRYIPGQYQDWLMISNSTCECMSESFKHSYTEYLTGLFKQDPFVQDLSVVLEITKNSDIDALVEKYQHLGSKGFMRQYIEASLKKNNSATLSLPCLLGGFIGEFKSKFASQSGPNCYNSSICISSGFLTTTYIDSDSFEKWTLTQNFSVVSPTQALKEADILIYFDKGTDMMLHAATVVVADPKFTVLFTKNGVNQSHPYLFQYKYWVESEVYFKNRPFYLIVLRRSETPLKANGLRELERYYEGTT